MRSTGRWSGAVLAIGIVVALLPVRSAGALVPESGPSGGTGAAAARPVAAGSPEHTVTLVTGDRVRLVDRGGRLEPVRVEPGPGRADVIFTTHRSGRQLRVVPSDAVPQLLAGRLDPRLFDVAALVAFGYDDTRADLPLIVAGGGAPGVAAGRAVPGGSAVRVQKKDLAGTWRRLAGTFAGGGRGARGAAPATVWLDGLRRPVLTESVPQVGAPAAWAAGFTGEGVTVGVIDSGIDATHPDLAGRVVAARNFLDGEDRDVTGHGTHVAATIAGAGADGSHRGVSPGAKLVSARVCDAGGCPESAILAAMQWVVDQGATVVNMSLGGPDAPGTDPLEAAVDRITAASGALFVIAAGNDGELGDETVGSPGSADAALTVGAVTKADELAEFSGRGPRLGDGALKPDLTAPGVDIVAAQSKDAPDRDPDVARVPRSGTSMATPHVAGAAAILAQRHPQWRAADLKSALMGSARTNPEIPGYAQGAGRLDVVRGIRQDVLANPPSVSVRDPWPLERDRIARTVTYRNTGAAAVTLALAVRTTAPAGMFTVSATSVTVPAGGSADVRLNINTRVPGVAARNVGHLVASDGERTTTTPFAVVAEIEPTYDVTINHLDRDGNPTELATTGLVDSARNTAVMVNGTGKVRLPKGRYTVMTSLQTQSSDTTAFLVRPVKIARNMSITVDARTARPVSIRVPQPDAGLVVASVFAGVFGDNGELLHQTGGLARNLGRLYVGPGRKVPADPAVESVVTALYGKRGVAAAESPYLTHAAWHLRGRMFPGVNRRVTRDKLATVRTEYAHHATATAEVEHTLLWPRSRYSTTDALPTLLPSRRVEYYNTDDGLRRQIFVKEGHPVTGLGNSLGGPVTAYAGGKTYRERRNLGVYGPGFTDPPLFDNGWVLRDGDTMRLRPTLLNDSLNWAGFPTGRRRPRLTLDRDGERIFDRVGNAFDVEVPAGKASYRLAADLDRGQPLSTRVRSEWTLRSGTTAAGRWTPLPLSAVRFLPPLDRANTAPAGKPYDIPFEVQRQPGSAAKAACAVTVEVSYDDGVTWLPARVVRTGQRGVAKVSHPAGPGFVSLRTRSEDTAGNTVDQTIIRAYRLA